MGPERGHDLYNTRGRLSYRSSIIAAYYSAHGMNSFYISRSMLLRVNILYCVQIIDYGSAAASPQNTSVGLDAQLNEMHRPLRLL